MNTTTISANVTVVTNATMSFVTSELNLIAVRVGVGICFAIIIVGLFVGCGLFCFLAHKNNSKNKALKKSRRAAKVETTKFVEERLFLKPEESSV
ncbi:hypothetical protein [Carp edema virus]|nr:hypothetical protein [Carp edema virus]